MRGPHADSRFVLFIRFFIPLESSQNIRNFVSLFHFFLMLFEKHKRFHAFALCFLFTKRQIRGIL